MSDTARKRGRLSAGQYVEGIVGGDRVTLARAITVVESELPADAALAEAILDGVLPHAGRSHRIGITGVPGSGKSTFIDALGIHLVRDRGEKIAVLSIDPSSPLSGGSILGDKTRMERLAAEQKAFIRPQPSRGHLGGVSRHTRESILLCEAAGYRNVVVETVGVGQSETAVRSMTDFFLLLMIPGAGDELQGMKRGIIEMLDGMVINKADGDNQPRAERARADYQSALHLFPPSADGWIPPVLTCSALLGEGIEAVWKMILEHKDHGLGSGSFSLHRKRQALEWMRELTGLGLQNLFHNDAGVQSRMAALEDAVERGEQSAVSAARELIEIFQNRAM